MWLFPKHRSTRKWPCFSSYAAPGVYSEVQISSGGQSLFGNARIPVIIGEGLQYFNFSNAELIRGSSAVADNQVVLEDLSDQVTGLTNTFQVTYFPVTDGTGKGVVTNDPSKIQVTSEGLPLVVVSLNGATGQFITQEIIPRGNNLQVSYYFKKTDTLIKNENLAAQIPTFSSLVYGTVPNQLTFGLTIPGDLGNLVTLAFTDGGTGTGVSDALAVSGAGTLAISINIRTATDTIRPFSDIISLVTAGIPTSYGYVTVVLTGSASTAATTLSPTNFSGGAGPQTNTIFKTHFTPIVDGTNGGVVTTNPALVTALVNGVAAVVTALDGQHGLVTLATGVPAGSTLTITYYTNKYQYTSDLLPGTVASITRVGLGPNRSDFIQGTDFELNQDGTMIEWGANADTAVGVTNPNSSAVFGPIAINTLLSDEQVWLRPVTGSVNGVNAHFTLQDVPVDGSGLNRPTDNPALISVYVGTNPVAAQLAGAVPVSQLAGDSASVTLYNPPPSGSNVYASYWRSQLNDHVFTLTVQTPGIPGQGTYSITNELGQVVPSTVVGPASVFDNDFSAVGIVWPNQFPHLDAEANDKTETVTVTFQDDDLHKILTPAVLATDNVVFSAGVSILFSATEIGAAEQDFTAPNGTTSIQVVNNAAEAIAFGGTYGSSPVYSGGTATPGPTLGHFFFGATPLAYSAPAAQWQASTLYAIGDAIYDSTTQSIQVVTTVPNSPPGEGQSGLTPPSFSASSGTTAPDNGLTWTSNGAISTSPENIYVNNTIPAGQRTNAQVAAWFSGSNVVNTPKAGQITAAATGSGLAIAVAQQFFTGGVNPTSVDYANRFLVTSSIAGAAGTGQATTPATRKCGRFRSLGREHRLQWRANRQLHGRRQQLSGTSQ